MTSSDDHTSQGYALKPAIQAALLPGETVLWVGAPIGLPPWVHKIFSGALIALPLLLLIFNFALPMEAAVLMAFNVALGAAFITFAALWWVLNIVVKQSQYALTGNRVLAYKLKNDDTSLLAYALTRDTHIHRTGGEMRGTLDINGLADPDTSGGPEKRLFFREIANPAKVQTLIQQASAAIQKAPHETI